LFITLPSQLIKFRRIKDQDDGMVYFRLPDKPDFFFAIAQDYADVTGVGIAL